MLVGAAAVAAVVAVAAAPTANADDPNLPVADSESARQTLNDITARTGVPGCSPGVPDVPLSQWTVTTVDGADAANGQGNVYVTINCPK